MKYVSEENLRNWFKRMEDRYSNCPMNESLKSVEMSMFDKFWNSDNLEFEEKEMKENDLKEELTDSTSQIYQILKDLTDRADHLQKEANRCSNLNALLVSAIQSDQITDSAAVACAISWLDHTDSSAWDIMKKIK